ncbi:hypothetical protein ES708_27380 [subsurface metagenome]
MDLIAQGHVTGLIGPNHVKGLAFPDGNKRIKTLICQVAHKAGVGSPLVGIGLMIAALTLYPIEADQDLIDPDGKEVVEVGRQAINILDEE